MEVILFAMACYASFVEFEVTLVAVIAYLFLERR